MRLLKRYACEDCGVAVERLRDCHQPLICTPCGIARALRVAVELAHAKAAGWPAGMRWTREDFAAPQRERWRRARERGVT